MRRKQRVKRDRKEEEEDENGEDWKKSVTARVENTASDADGRTKTKSEDLNRKNNPG